MKKSYFYFVIGFYLVLFVVVFSIVSKFNLQGPDDYGTLSATKHVAITSYLFMKWNLWSGRVFNDALTWLIISDSLLIWHILLSVSLVVICMIFSGYFKIINNSGIVSNKFLDDVIAVLISTIAVAFYYILFDFSCDFNRIYPSGGYYCNFISNVVTWFSGSVQYFFPLTLFLALVQLVLLYIYERWDGYSSILIIIFLTILVSFSIETLSFSLPLFYCLVSLYGIKERKKNIFILGVGLLILNIILLLLESFSPGNMNRYSKGGSFWSGGAYNISLLQKIYISLFYCLGMFFDRCKECFSFMLLILSILFKFKNKLKFVIIYGLASFLSFGVSYSGASMWADLHSHLSYDMIFDGKWYLIHNNYALLGYYLLTYLLLGYGVINCLNRFIQYFSIGLLGAGLLLSFIVGFSPMVFAVGVRLFFIQTFFVFLVLTFLTYSLFGMLLQKIK